MVFIYIYMSKWYKKQDDTNSTLVMIIVHMTHVEFSFVSPKNRSMLD